MDVDINEFHHILQSFGTDEPRNMDDPFFDEGDTVCRIYSRAGIVDEDDELLCHKEMTQFSCDVINCNATFDNLLSHDMHYNSCHRFTCSQCKKQLVSPHLLDLHLSETHDSFFQAQAERKPMYACFVESCPYMSKDASERKNHCIEEHKFPHDFKFSSKPMGKKKKPKKKEDSMEVDSKPKKNPLFQFGKKPIKTFNTKRPNAETSIEMGELLETLPQ